MSESLPLTTTLLGGGLGPELVRNWRCAALHQHLLETRMGLAYIMPTAASISAAAWLALSPT